MLRTLSIHCGSGDSLNVSVRYGCKPKACQIRLMVMRLSPVALAKPRVDQCVSPRWCAFQGLDHNLLDLRVAHVRGAPDRGSSYSASKRPFRNRVRHLPTMPTEQHNFRATI